MSRQSGYARLDEDDVRVRPGRGSRPRTRRRPAHETAVQGFVTSVDRGRYGCMTDGGLIVAMKARELGKGSVVVGDRVALAGDTSGAEGTLARIVRVEPRTSALRRSADDNDPAERIIVANADQMVIVCSLADPAPNLRFVDRCLVAAYDAGLDPLLLLTKADLRRQRRVRAFYRPPRAADADHAAAAAARHPVPDAVRADRPDQRAHRSIGRRQVHVDEHAGSGGGPFGRQGQPGDRSGQAHVVFPGGDPAGRRVAHRHAGLARVRARARERGTGRGGVRRPRRGHGRVTRPAAITSLLIVRWTRGRVSTTPRRAWIRCAACLRSREGTSPD